MVPVDLVIDHTVMVDEFGTPQAFEHNVELEYERNKERYEFLKWGSQAFRNFRVVPPGTGICHQVNLEYLGQAVWSSEDPDGNIVAYPDTLVGTDSHTTMINGLGVLGWGVGGIEAEAAMLGQPVSMLIPEVVGFKLTGELAEGITATDLVLTVVEMLRKKSVVGKFVEFYGPGLSKLTLADRATIANMAPEYGATCGFFPIDEETIRYMRFTGREDWRCDLVEAYAKAQGMWHDERSADPIFTDTLSLDLGDGRAPSLSGPKRPQDRVVADRRCDQIRSRHGAAGPFKGGDRARTSASRSRARITTLATATSHRRHHQLHQHVQPRRADRRRPGGAKGARKGPGREALGEDLAGAGIAGRHRLSRQDRADRRPRRARLRSGRLWLHDLHRQFGPAARADFEGDQ